MEKSEAAIGTRGVKETDSFLAAVDKGLGAVLTEYIPFIAGQGIGMIGEALVTSIAGGFLGSVGGPKGTIAGGLSGLVGKNLVKKQIKAKAEQIAKEESKEAAERYIEKEAKWLVSLVQVR